MKKLRSIHYLTWIKRFLIYFIGLYLMAMGVVFSSRSSLGVSPVGALANVLYQIFKEKDIAFLNLGNLTTGVYCLYILAEFIILRKDFKPSMLLQLVASIIFGQLVNLASAMLTVLPDPVNYGMRMVYLLCSIPLVGGGVMLYLSPNILPTPGEGMALAISQKTGVQVSTGKTIFDCTMVVISTAVSLIYFHGLVGVREGTVICALLVGLCMRQLQKPFQKPLLHFVERESKIAIALQAASGYLLDNSGNPKVIVTIGREFGSGGYDIGVKLAKLLKVPFYDSQINERAAQISNLTLEQVEEMEHHMSRELTYDFKNVAYSMTNGSLSPEEQLFVAQTTVIREIAASGESCVIMGRCADYVLYDDPNCFRVFIHARPDARIKRVMAKYNLTYEQAEQQMKNTDASRARHYKRFTGREYGKQMYYHLGLDSGMLGVDISAEMIRKTLATWCDIRGTHPLSTLDPDAKS